MGLPACGVKCVSWTEWQGVTFLLKCVLMIRKTTKLMLEEYYSSRSLHYRSPPTHPSPRWNDKYITNTTLHYCTNDFLCTGYWNHQKAARIDSNAHAVSLLILISLGGITVEWPGLETTPSPPLCFPCVCVGCKTPLFSFWGKSSHLPI